MNLLDYWDTWLSKELKFFKYNSLSNEFKRQYKKRGYLHFDPRFWLPERHFNLHKFLSNKDNVANRAFYPFLKVIVSTPRFRYDEKKAKRAIEYKKRPISYASHFDALIYSFYAHALTEIYQDYIKEIEIDHCISAYRTDLNKCNIDFANESFEYIRKKGSCTAIALDIKGFFNNLNHEILKKRWLKVLGKNKLCEDQYQIYKSLTKYAYINRKTLIKLIESEDNPFDIKQGVLINPSAKNFKILRERKMICKNPKSVGIPQGSPMSSVLSNIYMLDFDLKMNDLIGDKGLYRRYCDDILIVCDTQDVEQILEYTYGLIGKSELVIQKKKEEIVEFKPNSKGLLRGYDAKSESPNKGSYKSLQYLGFEFNGQNVFIRSSSMSRYYRKMKASVQKTIKQAYGKNQKGNKIFKKKLYEKYTHLGSRNFITYAHNAASATYTNSKGETKQGFDSETIRLQIARHFEKLQAELVKRSEERAKRKKVDIKY